MFRHDRSHTGRTPYSGPATPTLKWIFSAHDGIASSPTIGQDGTIYIGAGWNFRGVTDSSLYAIHPDGSLKWRFKVTNGIFSSPAIGPDGTLYVGSLDRHLYAIEDSVTYGKLRWKTHLNHWIYSSPALGPDGTIYVGSIDFHVYALHPHGAVKWNYLTDWCVFSSPAIGPDGEIYIGSKDHHLYAFEDSLTYANVRWQYATGQFYDGHLVDSSPAIGPDGTLYVGTDPYGAHGQTPVPVRSVFFAVNPNGTLKWVFPMDDGAESSPALGPDGTIYIGSYDGHLYAIRDEGNRGALQWKFSTGGWIDGCPTVDGCGVIYVGSRDSTVYAINPDGTLRWSFSTGGEIESSPTIDDRGILYIASFDGNLYALGTGGPDVGVASIDLPEKIEISTALTPAATVTNYRSDPRSFTVSCRIDSSGRRIYADTVRVRDLAEGASQLVAFAPRTVGPDPETFYNVTVITSLSGDGNWYNDTLSTQIETTEVIRGDVNGDKQIDGLDAVLAVNILLKRHAPTLLEFRAADCNGPAGSCAGDGVINILDTVKIVRLLLGVEECP
ncbi:MAG: PQQ-binding-like beta-propeller repeat protein [Gemmatimonadota bacterium]|nr:MAG: PQQ-binding-like beta-propeller repeat protein [Gemmatimonadota bacterium]